MKEDLHYENLVDYGCQLLFQLDSLFNIGLKVDDDKDGAFHMGLIGEALLFEVKDNLEKLFSMIEENFGDLVVVIKENDKLIKPIQIKIKARYE